MRAVTALWSIALVQSRWASGDGVGVVPASGSPLSSSLGYTRVGPHRAEGAKGLLAWCLVAAPTDPGAEGCEDLTLGVSCFHLGGPTAAHRPTSGHLREEQETWAHLRAPLGFSMGRDYRERCEKGRGPVRGKKPPLHFFFISEDFLYVHNAIWFFLHPHSCLSHFVHIAPQHAFLLTSSLKRVH